MSAPGKVRIIGGQWRGRQLSLGKASGLRPTPDRVRETLFNWLQPHLPGSRCLDLFAGSGVLGFEAVSRGAHSAVLVERDRALIQALRDNHQRLGAPEQVVIVANDASAYLTQTPEPFDLVLLDPPYGEPELLRTACLRIMHSLRPGALVYIESPAAQPAPTLPEPWTWFRQGVAGQVRFGLANAVDNASMMPEA
jgi:16S rRNA (guanine966-N2)-methyltransferase